MVEAEVKKIMDDKRQIIGLSIHDNFSIQAPDGTSFHKEEIEYLTRLLRRIRTNPPTDRQRVDVNDFLRDNGKPAAVNLTRDQILIFQASLSNQILDSRVKSRV